MLLPDLPQSTAPSIPALFEGQVGLEKVPDQLPTVPGASEEQGTGGGVKNPAQQEAPANPSELPESGSLGLKGPTPSAIQETGDKAIIGKPIGAAAVAPKIEEKKEPGAYQVPDMTAAPAAAPTAKPNSTDIAATTAPRSETSEEPPQWNHPERLQRTRWRESLGDSPVK
jgi:hypothetical protein